MLQKCYFFAFKQIIFSIFLCSVRTNKMRWLEHAICSPIVQTLQMLKPAFAFDPLCGHSVGITAHKLEEHKNLHKISHNKKFTMLVKCVPQWIDSGSGFRRFSPFRSSFYVNFLPINSNKIKLLTMGRIVALKFGSWKQASAKRSRVFKRTLCGVDNKISFVKYWSVSPAKHVNVPGQGGTKYLSNSA